MRSPGADGLGGTLFLAEEGLSPPASPLLRSLGADGLGGTLFLAEEGLSPPAVTSPWPEACPMGAGQCGLQLDTWAPSSSPRLTGT